MSSSDSERFGPKGFAGNLGNRQGLVFVIQTYLEIQALISRQVGQTTVQQEKAMRTKVWNDILIIIVLTKFLTSLAARQLIASPTHIALVLLALTAFLAMRSPMVQEALREGLSMATVVCFVIDIGCSEGLKAVTSFFAIVILLLVCYFLLRRFFPRLG